MKYTYLFLHSPPLPHMLTVNSPVEANLASPKVHCLHAGWATYIYTGSANRQDGEQELVWLESEIVIWVKKRW